MTFSHSPAITNLLAALHKVQGAVDGVTKDATNPHFRNRYASLEAVHDALRGPLQDAGLVVLQAPGELSDGALALTTFIAHAESGEWLRSTLHIPVPKNDPQGVGSALSYGERYSLMALFCLPAVDDDGEAAAAPQRPVQRPAPRPLSQGPERAEGPVAPLQPSPDSIRSRMLADVAASPSTAALERMTESARWKADFAPLPEAHRKTIVAAVGKRFDELARVASHAGMGG